MSDEPTQAPATPEASAPEAPAAQEAFDPARFKADLEASWGQQLAERISGIQSGYQQQLNQLSEENRRLKSATLTEEERAQQAEDEAANYVDDLEFRAALAELYERSPKAVPHILQLRELGNVADQAVYLESLLNPEPVTPEAAESVPPVDANNPPRSSDPGTLQSLDGKVLTDEMRKQILQGFDGMSFAEAQRRG